MAGHRDWLPAKREAVLEMARSWIHVLETKAEEWGLPAIVLTTLVAFYEAAKAALEVIVERETRTPVAITVCREAFKALMKFMRDTKMRYFHMPPLTPADFTALGFAQPDETKTPIGTPKVAPEILIETTRNHFEHCLRAMNPLNGKSSKPDGVHGVCYAWQIGGEKPASGKDLPRSQFNRKTRMSILHTEQEKGKIVYYAMCYENDSGDRGPWSQVAEAIIG